MPVAPDLDQATLQRRGLNALERTLVDLVNAGRWFEPSRLQQLDKDADALGESFLPGARTTLRRLVLLAGAPDLSEDERLAGAADLVARLWAMVQRGRNYLEGQLSDGETAGGAAIVCEDVLGHVWQPDELRARGCATVKLSLLELAHERVSDPAAEQQRAISYLLGLTDGAVYQAVSVEPLNGSQTGPGQPSYQQLLTVPEAFVLPGFLNRKLLWEAGTEQLRALKPTHLRNAYRHARHEFRPALDLFRQQLRQPLAPREAVLLLRCARIGTVGEHVILEDAAGERIEALDRRKDSANVANLVRAAGMCLKERLAVLCRLFLQPLPNTITAEPLALLTPKHHLRLGL
jgi:hypothetical protein